MPHPSDRTSTKLPPAVAGRLALATRMLRTADYDAAEALYRDILDRHPTAAEALHGSALVAIARDDHATAVALASAAIEAAPDVPAFHATLGGALRAGERPLLAVRAFAEAVRLNPAFAEAHLALASLQRQLGRTTAAVTAAEKAAALRPDLVATHTALGTALQDAGRNIAALAALERAAAAAPDMPGAALNLAVAQLSAQRRDDLRRLEERSRDAAALPQGALAGLSVLRAVAEWIADDPAACATALRGRRKVLAEAEDFPNRQVLRNYHGYLARLVAFRGGRPDLYAETARCAPLYTVGDSHCLSAAHTRVVLGGTARRVVPKLVVGCKAWHLATRRRNRYKADLDIALRDLPAGAVVLAMFGEIDCRADEGILPHFRKHGRGGLDDAVGGLVARYVDHLDRRARRRRLRLLVQGVPAPWVDLARIPETDRAPFLDVVRLFNRHLEARAAERGIPFVDVYAPTVGSDGVAHGARHLDAYHLAPDLLGERLAALASPPP